VVCYPYERSMGEGNGHLEMLKLLIADTGEEFRQALADQVRGAYRVRVCQEGNQALDLILAFKPDLLVLDMMLPGLDGISILEEAARCGVRPVVLAVTKYPTDYMIEAAARCGVRYMMVKPCKISATVARLQDLAEHLEPMAVSQPDLRTAVTNILLSLGISTKLRGYAYLREAILEMANQPGQSVTKLLYPAVGKICGASKIQVERSIRSAINKAWENRDKARWQMYFPAASGGAPERPTNAVFITAIADRVSRDPGIRDHVQNAERTDGKAVKIGSRNTAENVL